MHLREAVAVLDCLTYRPVLVWHVKRVDAVSGSAAYLDNLSQIQSRLNNINDGSQKTADLEAKIMAAANRSRGNYQAMADSVAKLNLLAEDSFKVK